MAASISREQQWSCFEAGARPGFSVVRLDGDPAALKRLEKAMCGRHPFTRLPAAVLNKDLTEWVATEAGRWRAPDHITLGEARGSLRVPALLANFPGAHRRKVVTMMDNLAWGGAGAKGRSPAPSVNFLCRRKCAYKVACEIMISMPWLDSPSYASR